MNEATMRVRKGERHDITGAGGVLDPQATPASSPDRPRDRSEYRAICR